MAKILEITHIAVCITPDRKHIVIHADGTVPTAGWTQPELSPWVYITPPEDGIWDFDFTATPPSGPAAMILTPVATAAVIPNPQDWLRGVRLHSSANKVEAAADPCTWTQAIARPQFDGDFPWPEVLRLLGGGGTVGNG